MPLRSFLFAPANHARRVEKSLTLDADAVILDLEDAVAVAEKPGARALAVQALQGPRRCKGYIRVNAMDTPFCWGDLQAVVAPGVDGIVLPKVESASGLLAVQWVLEQLERERGLPAGGIDLLPILETARGVRAVDAILGAGCRVRRVAFGAGDYSLDIGVTWSRDEAESRHARDVIVTASRAHGLEAPIDSVWARLEDGDGLVVSARHAAAIGYQGKMCIHPSQLGPVHAAFTPTAEEVGFARRVVDGFALAEAQGISAFRVDGKFVDYPILYRARRVIAIAEGIAAGAAGAS
ncbi:CoA ester lyase [Xylophilus sp. GOD-11R]|uniref:HpcH/HpaI aldolase/citrate lyase family protein n=1 Tax=Xylophilus sp. GOD-11R TaxID=3089814 RepID=UPI00298C530A|nr:CoA ester lyase [Xylophilus sp. GOD-11R]WPB58335.1 CoA ester lyase [Xylophilus sp. GOD-11R]